MKYTIDQAIRKCIDTINVLADPESANIQDYMLKYASLREIFGTEEFEDAYDQIAYSLWGVNWDGKEPKGMDCKNEEQDKAEMPVEIIKFFVNKVDGFNKRYHTESELASLEQYARKARLTLAEYVATCFVVTEHDIKRLPGGYNSKLYAEIKMLHEQKIIASNQHRQEHGHVDKWWFTERGIKKLNKKYRFLS